MDFVEVLGWVIAAGASGLAVGLYLGRDREQEQVDYLRGQLRESRSPTPDNLKALNPPAQSRGGL